MKALRKHLLFPIVIVFCENTLKLFIVIPYIIPCVPWYISWTLLLLDRIRTILVQMIICLYYPYYKSPFWQKKLMLWSFSKIPYLAPVISYVNSISQLQHQANFKFKLLAVLNYFTVISTNLESMLRLKLRLSIVVVFVKNP